MTATLEPRQIYGVANDDRASVRTELPEIDLLADPADQDRVAGVWASFMKVSSYSLITEAPAFPGLPAYDLARHTRQVVRNSLFLGDSMTEDRKDDSRGSHCVQPCAGTDCTDQASRRRQVQKGRSTTWP